MVESLRSTSMQQPAFIAANPSLTSQGTTVPGRYWHVLPQVPPELAIRIEEALQLPAAWASVRKITDAIASAPISVFDIGLDGKLVPQSANALVYLLNIQANPDQTGQALKEFLIASALVYGQGYARIVWDGAGRVKELRPLPWRRVVNVKRAVSGALLYEYANPLTNQTELIPDSDIIRVDGPCSLEGLFGASSVDAGAMAIALALSEATFARSYFANSAVIGLAVTPPATLGAGKDGAKEKRRFVNLIKKMFSGRNAHSVAVVPPGTEIKSLPINARDAMLLESRKLTSAEVAAYFGIHPALLGIDVQYAAGYGSNQASFRQEFVEVTLRPWVNRLVQELTRKLFPERRSEVTVDLTHIMRGSFQERAKAYEGATGGPWLTVDEAREMEGYGPIAGGGELRSAKLMEPKEPEAGAVPEKNTEQTIDA